MQQIAYKAFSWVAFATRPLTVDEILDALSVEEWSPARDPENVISIDVMLQSCMGLLTIQNASNTVHFSHFTARNYLLEHLEMIPTALYLAKVCLTYLLFTGIEDNTIDPDSAESHDNTCSNFPMLQYAAQNWTIHVK